MHLIIFNFFEIKVNLQSYGEEKVTSNLNFLKPSRSIDGFSSVTLLFMVIGPHFTFSPLTLLYVPFSS